MMTRGASNAIAVAALLLAVALPASGLKCFVGLGNNSEKGKQKVVECPEKMHYVCVKMFGGGMGDQIRRYCEQVTPQAYNDLLDKEERKVKAVDPSLEKDSECYEDVHSGRSVVICECTTDFCNLAEIPRPHLVFQVLFAALVVNFMTS